MDCRHLRDLQLLYIRVDPHRLLPSEQVSSKLGIDATRKHPYPAPSVPPQEHLDKVAALWERYGIREVRR